MTNEKVEILCTVCSVGPEKVKPGFDDDWWYVENKVHYVSAKELNHPNYAFVAQIGPYKVYAKK